MQSSSDSLYKTAMDHSRIDVHHHLFPPPFVTQLVEHEHYLSRGIARHWTPQVSLDEGLHRLADYIRDYDLTGGSQRSDVGSRTSEGGSKRT